MAASSSAAPIFAGKDVLHTTFAWKSDEPSTVKKAMGILSEWSLCKGKCAAHRDSVVWSDTGCQWRMKMPSTYSAAYSFMMRLLGGLVQVWGQGSSWRVLAVADVAEAELSQASLGQAPLPGLVRQEASPLNASGSEASQSVASVAVAVLEGSPSPAAAEHEHSWCLSPTFKLIRGGAVLDESRSRYTYGSKLGEGVYGAVYEGFRSGRIVAIKFIKACDDARTDAAAEAYVLDRCRGHPNIVQLVDVFRGLGPDMTEPAFALVFQHAGVSLTSIIRRKTLTCQAVRSAMADIVAGVGHLHGLGLVHGDIKPCNLLATAVGGFEAGGGDSWHVQVGDVGLASWLPLQVDQIQHTTKAVY